MLNFDTIWLTVWQKRSRAFDELWENESSVCETVIYKEPPFTLDLDQRLQDQHLASPAPLKNIA